MKESIQTSDIASLGKRQCKSKLFEFQMKRVFAIFNTKFCASPILKHRIVFYNTNQELFPLIVELFKRAGE